MATTSGFVQQPTTSFNPGFTQVPQVALPEVARTFEVPKVPTHTQTFGVPQVPTIGGGFLAPSGPGQPVTSLAPSGPGQPATSTVPSISAVSGGGDSGLGTAAVAGGGVALAALLSKLGGGKEEEGDQGLSFDNISSGAQKLFNLGDMGNGVEEMIGKLRDSGFDDIAKGLDDLLGTDSTFMPGSKAGEAFQLGPTEGISEFGGMEIEPTAGQELANLPGRPSPGAAQFATNFGPVNSLFPGAAANTAALMAAPGFAATVSTMPVMGVAGATSQISLIPSMGALAGATSAAPAAGAGAMAAMGPGLLAVGAIMALKASSQKDPGTLAAEAEQRFDQISATKSVAQKHGIQAAIDEFGYNQVLEYAPFFAPGAPGYTSPLLRDQRPDHAVLKEISADDPRGREILEFVASNRGAASLQGNTAELIKQLGVSTTPSARMREEMDFVLKQRSAPEEHRDYGISSNTREFKKGFTDALVDSGELTRIVDEHGIEYIKPGNYYESMEGY